MRRTQQRPGGAATCQSWWRGLVLVITTGVMWNSALLAQTFSSGSDGSDGELRLETPGVIDFFVPGIFNPPLDADADGVYHFTTITVASGVTVNMTRTLHGPVTWLATGAVQIDGVIDLNGEPGHSSADGARNSLPGAGGFSGGHGSRPFLSPRPGNGPGGGQVATGDLASGGGAGHASAGADGRNGSGGPAYGNAFQLPLIGGSGGAGGGTEGSPVTFTTGGGAGGGALLIASSEAITVNGTIRADAGAGLSNGSGGNGSGGGSGGTLRLMAPVLRGTGVFSAQGGIGGSNGGTGAPGRIRLEAFQLTFSGQTFPMATVSTPGVITLPVSRTPLRVVRIGGMPVPAQPSGSVTMADVVLDAVGAVPLEIAAQGIPPGTTVRVTLISETEGTRFIDTGPLEGTLAASTVTVNVTLSPDVSHILVQAMWSP